MFQPAINTLISLNAKSAEQGTAMGLNASYLAISNAIGPVIAGMTTDRKNLSSYGHSVYLAGGLTLLVLLLAVFTRRKYTVKAT